MHLCTWLGVLITMSDLGHHVVYELRAVFLHSAALQHFELRGQAKCMLAYHHSYGMRKLVSIFSILVVAWAAVVKPMFRIAGGPGRRPWVPI